MVGVFIIANRAFSNYTCKTVATPKHQRSRLQRIRQQQQWFRQSEWQRQLLVITLARQCQRYLQAGRMDFANCPTGKTEREKTREENKKERKKKKEKKARKK